LQCVTSFPSHALVYEILKLLSIITVSNPRFSEGIKTNIDFITLGQDKTLHGHECKLKTRNNDFIFPLRTFHVITGPISYKFEIFVPHSHFTLTNLGNLSSACN